MADKAKSLYVHIPFCRHLCSYCDFPKVLLKTGFYERYVPSLLKEDERYAGHSFETVYLGGGTPSCLPLPMLDQLLTELVKRHGAPAEFTLEANPEDVDESLCALLRKAGVNRVSLGAQSSSDRLLESLGRKHSYEDVKKAVALLRKAGFSNVSLDFIYGFSGQTLEDLRMDLEAVSSLDLPHASFYSLQVEPHTLFGIRRVKEADGDLLSQEYERIVETLRTGGLFRYEVSNFAKPGYECRHNLCYWRQDPYGAIGVGATSYEGGVREVRTRSIERYLAGHFLSARQEEDMAEREFDFLMLNLRLEEGFSLSEFSRRFRKDFLSEYRAEIEKLRGDLSVEEGRVRVKPDRIYILDSLLVELLHFKRSV